MTAPRFSLVEDETDPAHLLAAGRDWALDSATLAGLQGEGWRRHVLSNGLTVLLQPREGIALVHIAVGYRVGSMEEGPGQTGLAHFLEHMMFAGTRQLPGSYIERMIELGATDVNAMTSRDTTRYWQTVPSNQLDFVLYAEADRMASFADNLDPAIIERERGVIQEEKRQNAAGPLGMLGEWLADGLLDRGHPYRHPVIGHVQDIAHHDLAALRAWHATYYGPANAVVVVAGGIDPDATLELVERHFSGIAPVAPATRITALVPSMPRQTTMRASDRMGSPGKFFMAWNTPSVVATPRVHLALELAAEMLGGGRSGLLYEQLVEHMSLASDVIAWMMPGRASGTFVVSAELTAAPDARVGDAIQTVIDRFLDAPDLPERLKRAQVNLLANRWRATVDFEQCATRLIDGELLHGDAGWADSELKILADIGVDEVLAAAREWLTVDGFRLSVDRIKPMISSVRAPFAAPRSASATEMAVSPPAFHERRLASGATLRVSRQTGSTAFHLRAIGAMGRADEPIGLEGIAQLAASTTAIGAGPNTAAELGARLRGAGLSLSMDVGLRSTTIDVGGPVPALPAALAVLSDIILRPRYGSPDYVRRLDSLVASAAGQVGTPDQQADAALHNALLGSDHRLSAPKPAIASLAEVLSLDAMQAFHAAAWNPSETLFLLAADIDVDAAAALCDAMLDGWQPVSAPSTPARLATAAVTPGVHVIDKPGSDTVQLSLAWRPDIAGDDAAILSFHALVNVLTGNFTSRANRRLREELGWTYGVMGHVAEPLPRRDPIIGFVSTSLDADRSGEAMLEIEGLIHALSTDAPPLEAEIEAFRRDERQRLARLTETSYHAVDALENMVDRGYRTDEDWTLYRNRIEALDPKALQDQAGRLLPGPEQAVWVLVGDAVRIRASLARQNLIDRVVDANG